MILKCYEKQFHRFGQVCAYSAQYGIALLGLFLIF